jgi:hypothetical protein
VLRRYLSERRAEVGVAFVQDLGDLFCSAAAIHQDLFDNSKHLPKGSATR